MQQVTEEQLAAAAVAPRVTEVDVLANIAHEVYFTAADGELGGIVRPMIKASDHLTLDLMLEPTHPTLPLLTFCVLVLKNGFSVTGESACASPENFNPEIGRALARKAAVSKIWAFMGYELRSKLAAT